MADVRCPAGRETAIEMLKRMLAELESGAFDSLFTNAMPQEAYVNGAVHYALGDELGRRGLQLVLQTAGERLGAEAGPGGRAQRKPRRRLRQSLRDMPGPGLVEAVVSQHYGRDHEERTRVEAVANARLRREDIAEFALNGLLSRVGNHDPVETAKLAVACADALIAELDADLKRRRP